MRFIIEVFERPGADGAWAGDSGYVAIATREGQIVANGGPGSGGTQRAAIIEAVNALFKREDERERAENQPLVEARRFTAPAPPTGLLDVDPVTNEVVKAPAVSTENRGDFGNGTIEGYFQICRALRWWIDSRATGERPTVFIDYKDASGNRTHRQIIPTGMDMSQTSGRPFRQGSAKLTAIDVAKDEPRHFIVDRIEKLVFV